MPCPECGFEKYSENVEDTMVSIIDPTLSEEQQLIPCKQTVYCCDSCKISWTDIVGEAERSNAILHYFMRRAVELHKELQSLRAKL